MAYEDVSGQHFDSFHLRRAINIVAYLVMSIGKVA